MNGLGDGDRIPVKGRAQNIGQTHSGGLLNDLLVHGYAEERPTKAAREARPAEPPRTAATPAAQPTARAGAAPAQGQPAGVQLASGPSVDALRLSWQLLQESHKSAIRALEPRFEETAGDPPQYRLIAGPLATSEDAEKLCERLRARRLACAVTPYGGKPL